LRRKKPRAGGLGLEKTKNGFTVNRRAIDYEMHYPSPPRSTGGRRRRHFDGAKKTSTAKRLLLAR
jgi:hypothetical protein